MLITGGVLPPRDEELARTERWLAALLDSIQPAGHRRLVHAFATWHVIRRLRHRARTASRPRTYTASGRREIKAAAEFLAWLAARGTPLTGCRQAHIDDWLATGPAACNARGFLAWAAGQGHCPALEVPRPARQAGTAISPEQRWELATRLLHDDNLQVTDRVAGCLVLLFGQNMTRVAALTTSDVISSGQDVSVRLGRHEVPVPDPLGRLLLTLIQDGKPYTGIGSRPDSRWLSPGCYPAAPSPGTARRTAPRPRHPRQGRAACRTYRPRSPDPRGRARRPPRPAPHHGRDMDAPSRQRLVSLRRATRPDPQSPTMTNNPQLACSG